MRTYPNRLRQTMVLEVADKDQSGGEACGEVEFDSTDAKGEPDVGLVRTW